MSTKRPLVFVDLDDTLFQTARKMPEGVARAVATLDVNGQPNGFMTPVQQALVDWLLGSADVVPVTARSVEAYSRGAPAVQPRGDLFPRRHHAGWPGAVGQRLAWGHGRRTGPIPGAPAH
jgi:hypothetical protein